MTETKYTIEVWDRESGLKTMSILINTSDDKKAITLYEQLIPLMRTLGCECAFKSSLKTTKELHRSL
jgi:hypothetical protein